MRRSPADDSATRTALLDAAEALMLEEGYAAVTTRRVAAQAGVNSALVAYYFGAKDGLFIELFHRGANRSLERLRSALTSEQPLWALWELTRTFSENNLIMEFTALANHRPALRAEIAAYSKTFRTLQVEALSDALEGYGVDPARFPPAAMILLMASVSRFVQIEDAFDVDIGHQELLAVIEREIQALEGKRRPERSRVPERKQAG
jgi:AcrR family transcriptional regulator